MSEERHELIDKLKYLKSKIPKGIYCHGMLTPEYDEVGNLSLGGYVCPFWEMKEVDGEEYGYCHLTEEMDSILLWDQCKTCGINEDCDEYDEPE